MASESKRPVALVGLRCTGKTSVGRRLAELAGWSFVDLDDCTAVLGGGASAGEVLAEFGEVAFRRLEAAALDEVLDGIQAGDPPCILATGGGIVETAPCRARLAAETTVVWLAADPAVLGRRLRSDPTVRPSLTGADPAEELATLLQSRGPLFREVATWRVDAEGEGVEEIAARIHNRLFATGAP